MTTTDDELFTEIEDAYHEALQAADDALGVLSEDQRVYAVVVDEYVTASEAYRDARAARREDYPKMTDFQRRDADAQAVIKQLQETDGTGAITVTKGPA